ncbi:regulatory protein RecX [Croceicoccus bisphenolivorans]|uniref:regulatory protein RecX n=1 Tax=Croceicoccus bisphenolivorans TaxID=1783232 RepID=UPI000AEFE366|nr:regulatory protein RecX [Croceicoccus bisphenolivorans]
MPLNAASLDEMALAYVARFATTAQGLERYCRRKLRERGWEGQDDGAPAPDVAALVERFVANRYVDDSEYARARSGSLLRRGYGARRVGQALDAAGVSAEDRDVVSEVEARRAALRLAEKRRFGPFGADGAPPADRAVREKQLAAMLRAGHPLDTARRLVEAADADMAREWADVAGEEGS